MELTARQIEVADAGLRVLAHHGFGAVSFRAVAGESGWSLGAVQKAFPNKDELLAAMMHRMRVTATTAAFVDPGRPTMHRWLTNLLISLQPLDAARRDTMLRAIAFDHLAHHNSRIARAIAASDDVLRRNLASLTRKAQLAGDVDPRLDADAIARTFLTLADGMASQLLYDPIPAEAAEQYAEYAVARLLGIPLGETPDGS